MYRTHAKPESRVPRPDVAPSRGRPLQRTLAVSMAQLQHTLGNRALQRLIRVQREDGDDDEPGFDARQFVLSDEEIKSRGTQQMAGSGGAPSSGANLWLLTNPSTNTRLYLLGSMHAGKFALMAKTAQLGTFLTTTHFDAVYEEVEGTSPPDAMKIKEAYELLQTPVPTGLAGAKLRAEQVKRERAADMLSVGLDYVYCALATRGGKAKTLETEATRQAIRNAYQSSGVNVEEKTFYQEPEDEAKFYRGDERREREMHAGFLLQGSDRQDIEARNRHWISQIPGLFQPGQTALWVIGVGHIAGITDELKSGGWQAQPQPL